MGQFLIRRGGLYGLCHRKRHQRAKRFADRGLALFESQLCFAMPSDPCRHLYIRDWPSRALKDVVTRPTRLVPGETGKCRGKVTRPRP
jgi:hypothetical protein